jgi:hypothetical protein
MEEGTAPARWSPPYDPRRINGCNVVEDEHGRWIESADCSLRCPGCGLCCADYRDKITADYGGTEEYKGNLQMGRGGLARRKGGSWYRVCKCGPECPGYGQCCPPIEGRVPPETIDDARQILLESDTSQRWEMEEALLILGRARTDEAVEVLEAYMPVAHTRLEELAECAREEAQYYAVVAYEGDVQPMTTEQKVLWNWRMRASGVRGTVERIESSVRRDRYEVAIMQRVLNKSGDDAERQMWQDEIEVIEASIEAAEHELVAKQHELALCEAMIAEIEADLGPELSRLAFDPGKLPF